MKISINTIRTLNEQFGSAGDPASEGVPALTHRIGVQLGAVEEVINFGKRFDGVLIVRVISCEAHPNADRLHVCKIDDGGRAEGVERDEQGHVQVVCGAPNVRAGLAVAWLPPGVTVPNTYDKDPFVLEARALRGVVSNGMLASPKELSIGDNHEGILEIDEDFAPGTPFAEAYHLKGDVVIDMENKMFTHRPDCFGWLGIARELEGIQHRAYKSPDWYQAFPRLPEQEADELKLEIQNELPELVPRFVAITMRDVQIGPSPVWLQIDLARVGLRPINNIVDLTNYYMLLTGQPLHAYDYDKVKAQDEGADHATIVVRHPRQGEKLLLLNGKEVEPRNEAIMIATRDRLIGVGGVMGGGDTEVDEHTKNIIIECATFDMYSIRRTSMAHGLFTDAVTRFNKGQSPLQNLAVLAKIVEDVRRFADGKVASEVIDDNHVDPAALERQSLHEPVRTTAGFINARLGWNLSTEEMSRLLTNVEFRVATDGDQLTVTAPFWRTDIEQPEDVVEEVGRLYGFDRLPLDLPKRDLTPAPKDAGYAFKFRVASILARAGANELLTYNFVHGNLLDKATQDREHAFRLSNALSPELQYLRVSLTPSLLERVHPNIKAGFDEFALFEINKTHNRLHESDDAEGLPQEFMMLALVYAASDKQATGRPGAAYYQARAYLDYLAAQLGVVLEYKPLPEGADYPVARPFEPGRSALVSVRGGQALGQIGEYKQSVLKQLKLPRFAAGFEVDFDGLQQAATDAGRYAPTPRFPKVTQDICLKVPVDTPYAEVFDFVWKHLQGQLPDTTLATLEPVDIYQREDDTDHKQITLRLAIASYERTLTDDEVNAVLESVAAAAKEGLGAERI